MHKRPLVFVALAYIFGVILGKYYFITWWTGVFIAAALSMFIFIESKRWKTIGFYLGIAVIGYVVYQVASNFETVSSYPYRLTSLREHIRNALYYNFPDGCERDLLSGLFLGERSRISNELLMAFQKTNTMHILAISGLHVGFIGLLFIGVLRLLSVPRKTAAILAILGILLYVSMVGWRPPAARSAVLLCILLMGWVLDRPVDSINSLFLAALVILLVNPQALFKAGFQLSFIVVFGLLLMAPVIARQKGFLFQALSGSATAWLASLPLVAYYFDIVSPISVLANIVVVPVVGLVIALAFTSVLLGQVYLAISGIFNCANYYLLKWLIWFIDCMADVPGGYFYISGLPLYTVFILYVMLIAIFFVIIHRGCHCEAKPKQSPT